MQLLVDRRVAAAAETSSPAQIHDREGKQISLFIDLLFLMMFILIYCS